MLFKKQNSLKTAYKSNFLRFFFDADYQSGANLTKVKILSKNKELNTKELNEKLDNIGPVAEKTRYDFVFGGNRYGQITFDDMYNFIMGDRFNQSLLTDTFGDKINIKKFLDFYFLDAMIANRKDYLSQVNDSNSFVPVQYLVFFVQDTSFSKKIVKIYKERKFKVPEKILGEFLGDFYRNYCLTNSFYMSDYLFHNI